MTLHTWTYVVERQFIGFNFWTRVETYYACSKSESEPTEAQITKAWKGAFESAQALEKAGCKVRISAETVTSNHSPVWEGK
jgi:hypothetical protein